MGNAVSSTVSGCFVASGPPNGRHLSLAEPLDEGFGHSFYYIRPSLESFVYVSPSSSDPSSRSFPNDSAEVGGKGALKVHPETTFKAISGASVSANTSTPCTMACNEQLSFSTNVQDDRAAAFESTSSFSALPLQPIPKDINPATLSGPISGTFGLISGPLERGFMSGPLERSTMSGPMETILDKSHFSAPLPVSHSIHASRREKRKPVSRFIASVTKPMKKFLTGAMPRKFYFKGSCDNSSFMPPVMQFEDGQSLQWAQGKAGEDRMHVVLSDTQGWLFVGIYDGFSGPDAPNFLMRNLYPAIYKELEGLLCDQAKGANPNLLNENNVSLPKKKLANKDTNRTSDCCFFSSREGVMKSGEKSIYSTRSVNQNCARALVSEHARPQDDAQESVEHLKEQSSFVSNKDLSGSSTVSHTMPSCRCDRNSQCTHSEVLKALASALEQTEAAYFDMVNQALKENPELALMGSCILVMLMKDEDVYVMNVGDSRAIVAQQKARENNSEVLQFAKRERDSLRELDLEHIVEETPLKVDASYFNARSNAPALTALQLSTDHNTSIDEEVLRIKAEHPDDDCSVINNRVKGTLKVTRSFGAGFLKRPELNDAILKAFRINYVGTAPYISCRPSLHHHRLSPDDRFLILSSDGLYQYMSNQEAVQEVQTFMERFPEGDPAQHLVEELLFRAAKKAGMDFHELLDVPQGDRRKYHDDVSVMVISLDRVEIL